MRNSVSTSLLLAFVTLSASSAYGAGERDDLLRPPPEDFPLGRGKAPVDPESAAFQKFQRWARVNAKPAPVAGEDSARCAPPPPPGGRTNLPAGPARPPLGGTFNVYVNDLGRPAFKASPPLPFPEGSIIVKERVVDGKGPKRGLALAMVKRDEGYNPAMDDWEFFILHSGQRVVVTARGKLPHCQECHAKAKPTDFVFGHYARR